MPPARRPPAARRTPPRPPEPRRAPTAPAARPAAVRPAQRAPARETRPARSPAPAHVARASARAGSGTRPRPPARRPQKAATRKPGRPVTHAKQAAAPVAHVASTQWYRMLASYYNDSGGGSCGNLQDGHFHFAELGVAGSYVTRAVGRGNMAIDLGLPGQLHCGAGGWIRYRGRTTYATKADVGYGNTSVGANAPSQRRIDLYRGLADYLGMHGVDVVEFAPNFKTIAQAQGKSLGRPTYVNPCRDAHVTPERIDMGCDYAGTGYFNAIADCIVWQVVPNGISGWPGAFIEIAVTSEGPLNHYHFYYAEGVEALVHKGQRLKAGDRVARLIPGWHSGTELGIAAGVGTATWASKYGGGYIEGHATRAGIAFNELVVKLGGPSCHPEGPTMGTWPGFASGGTLSGVILPGPSASNPAFVGFGAQGEQDVALQFDWGKYVKQNWKNLDDGTKEATHHSNAAKDFAQSHTYVKLPR